jgi:hypothetical protein
MRVILFCAQLFGESPGFMAVPKEKGEISRGSFESGAEGEFDAVHVTRGSRLDLGLAKAFEATPGALGVTSSPTLTSPNDGTGQLGCVLYKMLTGRLDRSC